MQNNDLPDDLDPVILGELQAKRTRMQATLSTAVGVNPDERAKYDRLATFLDVPRGVVSALPADMERKAKLQQVQNDAATSPVLQRKYTDADFAALAHDDSGALSAIASAAKYLVGGEGQKNTLGGDLLASWYKGSGALYGGLRAVAETAAPLAQPLAGTLLPENPISRFADMVGKTSGEMNAIGEHYGPTARGIVAGGVSSGVQSLGQNAKYLPLLAFGPAGGAAALAGMVTEQFGSSYQEARQKGIGPMQALPFAASQAAIEYATEKLPMGKLLGDLQAGASLKKVLAHQAMAEIPGEQIATVLQDMNEWAVLHPEKPFSDYLAERPSAAAQTLIATLVGVGGNVAISSAAQKAMDKVAGIDRQAQVAEQAAQTLANVQQTMEASKLLERSPDTLRSYMQDLADQGVPVVYVDAKALSEAGVDLQALAEQMPSVAAQVQQAVETGGDLAIPTGELLTDTIGTTFAQTLIEHARTAPDAMSRAEAQMFMQEQGDKIKAEVEQALAAQDQDAQFKADREALHTQVLEQLNALRRFNPKVNEQYAALLSNFYSVMAARAGVSPQEFAKTYALEFSRKEAEGLAMDQGDIPQSGEVDDLTGLPLNEDGTVTVYHHTSKENADKIRKAGMLKSAGEPDLYFTTTSETNTGYGDTAIPFRVKPERLQLDDEFPDGRQDYRVESPARGRRVRFLPDGSGVLNQGGTAPRAQISMGDDITQQPSIISLLEKADLSSFIHESGHFFLEVQADLASRIAGRIARGEDVGPGAQGIVDDFNKVLDWAGVKGSPEMSAIDTWHAMTPDEKRPAHEKWARGFEAFAFEGKAPSLDLARMFQAFRAWMLNVYRQLTALNVQLTDEVRDVMGRMLATAQQIEETEAARDMGPLFKTAEQAGMSIEEFKAYHDLATQATLEAVDELTRKGLKDMQWLSRARSKILKTLQAEHDTERARIRHEVRGEVMSQPVYQAWQFLTGKKPHPGEPSEAMKAYELERADHKQKRAEAEEAATKAEREKVLASNPEAKGLARGQLISKNKRQIGINVQQAMLDWDKAHPAPERPNEQADSSDPALGAGKLSTEALKQAYGNGEKAVWRKLSERRMTSGEGLAPDLVAEMFGFSSGDELIQALAAAEDPQTIIEARTDQRMLEEHGDLSTHEGLQRAADQAVHGEARARFIARELDAVEKAGKVAGDRGRADVMVKAAKEYAAQLISRLKVRDLRPGQYAAAEARSAREARKSVGDVAKAAEAKRNQLINLQAAKAAYAAQDEVRAAVEYMRKFSKASTRQNLPAEYLAQIDMLLEKFDLAEQSGAAIDRTVALRTWVQSRLNAGEIPNISEALLTPAERRAYEAQITARDDEGNLVYPDDEERIKLLADAIERSQQRSYKDMTVEELRGLRDTIKQMEHLARLKSKMLTARDGKTYAETRDTLVAGIKAHAKDGNKLQRTRNDWLGKKLDALAAFGVSHIKVATWLRIFDGGQDGGAWWSTVVRPANERAAWETTQRAEATAKLVEILGPVLKKVSTLDLSGKGKFFPELGPKVSLNWQERFAIALNYGNESNLQRLQGGGIAGVTKTLSQGQIHAVLRTLTAEEWTAVQAIWDHFETYRPLIGEKEKRVNGIEPEWIAARPFNVRTADGQSLSLRGGYFPVVFDPKTSLKAEQHADAQAAKDAMKAAYSAATTQRSFTKSRVEEVKGRPLLLNLQGLYSGVNDVIHDLAWHEWVIDFNRLMRSNTIDEAIREHYGANVKKELTKWRDDIVAGSKRLDHGVEKAAGWARKFVSSSALTFNVMSAIMQPLGITQSISRVGAKWVGQGVAEYLSGPIDATERVREQSEFMRNRTRTMFRDLNELRNRVEGQTSAQELMGRYGYFLTMQAQMTVDVPTWIGAHAKALAEGHSDDTAVALADQAVKDSQGGGEEVDQAGITRGGPMIKLFTSFYEFMNTQANVLYLANATSKSRAEAFMHFALVGAATPILAAALKDALTPGDSGDWDDWGKIVKKMITEGLSNLLGMMAFGREFTLAAKALLGEDKGQSYNGPAGLRVIPELVGLSKQVHQGELDDGFRKAFVNILGDLTGIPAVQINRTVNGAEALSSHETANPASLVFGFQRPH